MTEPSPPALPADGYTSIGYETRELADSLPLIVWTARPDGGLDFYNQRWFDYTGLTAEQTYGWGWASVLHPDDLSLCMDVWSHSVSTGEFYQTESRFKRASDGTYRWHLVRALPVRGGDGLVVRWFGTCTDIDDHKRLLVAERSTREALARSGRRFASLVEASAEIVWTTDATGAMQGIQEGWGRYTGQSPHQYQRFGWLDATHPANRARTRQEWQAAIASGEPWSTEQCLRRADGAWRDMSVRAVPIREDDGVVREWVGAHSDITEQKQAERERERAQQETESTLTQLEAVLISAQDGIVLSDPDGSVRMWNPAALAMHEYGKLEDAHFSLSELTDAYELWDAQGSPMEVQQRPLDRLMRDDLFTEYEVQVRRKDTGTVWWASYNGSVVRSKDGSPLLLLLTVRDVSERRRMEAQRDALLQRIEEAARKQRRFLTEMLSSMTEGRLRLCDGPRDLPAPAASEVYAPPITLSRASIRTLRMQVDACCKDVGLSSDRQNDLVTSVGEAAMNAVVHAGSGEGRIYCDTARGLVQVWVRDQGQGINEESLHRATLEKGFSSVGTLGHGFWMMFKTADRVYLLTGTGGTTIVLEQDRYPPLPAWLQTHQY